MKINRKVAWGAAIAPLRLPSCGPGFKSQAHHLHFFQFLLLKLLLKLEKNENKQKEAGIGHKKTQKSGRGWPIIFLKNDSFYV